MSNTDWLHYPMGKIPKDSVCPHCARYNSRNVVGHAVAVRDGKLLMIKRGIEPMVGWWALPAGYLNWDESVEECALRELREEAGVDGKIKEMLGVYGDPKRDRDGRQNVAVVYVVEPLSEAKVGEEVQEVRWFELDNLPEKIAFDHRKMIEDYQLRNNE